MEELLEYQDGFKITRDIIEESAIFRETHKDKMARKKRERDLRYRSTGQGLILANISRNHIDYGMSPAEHLRAKQERVENNS